MKTAMFALLLFLCMAGHAATGTLIPADKQSPDPSILSLEEMRVNVTIDNGDAHVSIVQIFSNHTDKVQEGTYRFALPSGSTVSDFAVWDGPVRIPAVILERKRAEQVYDEARMQAIDPGLLEASERDDSNPQESSLFTAKIVPIPAYGTKRLEIDYHQRLSTSNFKQAFFLSLKPDAGEQQAVHTFSLRYTLHSAHGFEAFTAPSKLYPLALNTNDPHTIEATFSATNLSLDEDFSANWLLSHTSADTLEVITHRDPHQPLPGNSEPVATKHPTAPEPGFFKAQLLVADPGSKDTTSQPRTVILLFDNSLSMQWDKLERSYAAFETTLRTLHPGDRFNVILFNQDVTLYKPEPFAATADSIHDALEFVRSSRLRGGTDLLKALTAALKQSTQAGTSIALFTDGGSDRGETVLDSKIAARYTALWKQSPHSPQTDVFAVGDDANTSLLRKLAQNGGFLEAVLSTEPVDVHLQSWASKLTRNPLTGVTLNPINAAETSLIYPLDDAVYPGSLAQWVGQYRPASKPVGFTVRATRDGAPVTASAQIALPETDLSHPQLPRLWAQARVNALLAEIDSEGESAAAIDEIIRLSRRYKFVTPYTSFLAVPRSLLRPRVIRPGDPVLRVRTDVAIDSVIAIFPFGLIKPLRHLSSEDLKAPGDSANRLWETRFLAPPEMKDGTYNVRLVLRDTHGNTYTEAKTFVIASTPPTVKVQLPRSSVHRGESIEIRASASASTRNLTAHMEGIAPASLHWNARAQTNTGVLSVPSDLAIGRYTLTVTAEDVAHNLGSQEVSLDVIP
ncbi:VIT and vWA domain-containing protein [Granulicella paludicola]|uniref:VIT and vWA domain-containing protein n=1 Tax=Granulicella paludicola TaxID=474951 RepID=UPI0021E0B373|nr:VIT and VWA domain-containing protein [Granulicella paludicola]